MKPVLYFFDAPLLGRVEIPAYFTLLTLGFALGIWMAWRESKRLKLDPDMVLDLNLWMVVWGIIGARVLHLIADGHFHEYVNLCFDPKKVPAYDPPVAFCNLVGGRDPCGPDFLCDLARHVCYPPKDCFAAIEVWRGGLAYYGGFLFAVAFAVFFMRKHKMPVGRVSDVAAPAIAFGLFFGRVGCFFNGCCYGTETASFVGVRFPRWGSVWRAQLEAGLLTPSAPWSHAVHPTQLYEAVACLAIAAFLYFVVRPHKRRDGDVIAAFMLLYAIARSVIEVFRDDDRGVFFNGHISTSQIISLPLAGLALFIVWYTRRAPLPIGE